jgi:hypothetical protein
MTRYEIEQENLQYVFAQEKDMLAYMQDGEKKTRLIKLALAYSNDEYNFKYLENLKTLLQVVNHL